MSDVIDKRINVDGVEPDDVVYNEKGNILTPIAPKNITEAKMVDDMLDKYTSTTIKQDFYLEEPKKENTDNLVIT